MRGGLRGTLAGGGNPLGARCDALSLARQEYGAASRKGFPARARELAADDPALASVAGSLLSVSRA